ncbi:MAG: PaaI family thioesterase [Elusimicrobia bacterium]|nr:PaaI family thioesterase [Elusimicrobiota bacterium]
MPFLPWTRACFVCGQDNPHGLRLRCRLEGGRVLLAHTAREADLGWKTFVHGGITMSLLDEAMAWAAIVAARRPCVTAELSVRLRRPAAVGMRLSVEGTAAGAGGRILATAGRVLDADGNELAAATAKFAPMNAEAAGAWLHDLVVGPETMRLEELFPAAP